LTPRQSESELQRPSCRERASTATSVDRFALLVVFLTFIAIA
jgi:hypothetical protein